MSNIEHIIDLKPQPREDSIVAFVGFDTVSNQNVEIRFLPDSWRHDANLKRLNQRFGLLKLAGHPSLRKVIEVVEDRRPIRMILEPPVELDLNDWIERAGKNLWGMARQLVDIVACCHRFGLTLGQASFADLRVGEDDRLRVDAMLSLDASTDEDLLELARSLARILKHDLGAPGSDGQITPRHRAMVTQRLRNLIEDDFGIELPDVQEWQEIFGEIPNASNVAQRLATIEQSSPNMQEPGTDETVERPTSLHSEVSETPTTDGDFSEQGLLQSGRSSFLPCEIGEMLGRFRLESVIGRGGMGVVYGATDIASGERVAVKVLRVDSSRRTQAIQRFRKEARLLGDIENEYVTRLIEVGCDREQHYMAMELVEGTDLAKWLKVNSRLEPEKALRLTADIACGLVDAHARGIVHRDIKPENVLLQLNVVGGSDVAKDEERAESVPGYHVKVSDFGIARYVHQSESMEVTRAGSLLGTPTYMSPEQCKGEATITPAADVYSLGVTLYQLLAGEPPFNGSDPMKMAAMHCFEAPPALQRRNPAVTDTIAQIVARALAKDPDQRYGDASQMLREIRRVLNGQPSDMQFHPQLPSESADAFTERRYQWDLQSSPAELWHFVSNTERLNRAIGLSPVEWQTFHDPNLGLRRYGSFKVAGIRVQWEEHPFEWIEGSRMGVLREFAAGPFRVFMSTVELMPLESGGTRLVHTLKISPRGTLGRLLIKVEIDRKTERNLSQVYHRMDESIQARAVAARVSQSPIVSDPFERNIPVTSVQRKRISDRCERVIERGVTPAVAGRMADYLLKASAQSLSQIRPLALADELFLNSDEMIDACLIASTERLMTLMWDILCPTCRVAALTVDALSAINKHSRCEACNVDFDSGVSDSIELVFRAHPEVRDVDTQSYCIGGPAHSPHVVAQVRLASRERLELDVALASGDYVLRGPKLLRQQMIRVRSENAPSDFELPISQLGTSIHTPLLRSGRQAITLVNDYEHVQTVRLERQIARDNVVTAAVACTLPRFRELFPDQTFDRTMPIMSNDITLLASGINNVESLYASFRDADAYKLIRELVELQTEVIVSRGGTVAKSIGEGLLAAFHKCDDAVAASFEIHDRLKQSETFRMFVVNIALHRGQVLITTQNDRLDYFGAAVRLPQSILSLAMPIAMTDAVFADRQTQLRFAAQFAIASTRSVEVPGHGTLILLCVA